MDLPRERLVEIVASAAAVILMIGVLVLVGQLYTVDGEFTETGGLMLVLAIMLFVLLMAIIGYVLAFTITTQEALAEPSD